MPSITEMFPSKYLHHTDFPMNEMFAGTIKHVVLEAATARFGGGGGGGFGQQQQMEPSWLLYFHEYPKPMKLKKTKAEQIALLVGSSKTEDWAGKRISFYHGTWVNGGQTGEGLMIDSRPLPIERQIEAKPSGPVFNKSNRRIPPDALKRFTDTIAGFGMNWDDFLKFLKRQNEAAFTATWGIDLPDVDSALLPLMKGYLELLHSPAPKHEPVVEQPPQTRPPLSAAFGPSAPRSGPLAGSIVPEEDIPF